MNNPEINEEFIVRVTIGNENNEKLTISYAGRIIDCNVWLSKIERIHIVLKYSVEFKSAEIIMV